MWRALKFTRGRGLFYHPISTACLSHIIVYHGMWLSLEDRTLNDSTVEATVSLEADVCFYYFL